MGRGRDKERVIGIVTYRDAYRFAKKQYELGNFPHQLSDDFWRKENRQGRKAVDEANKIITDNVMASKKREVAIINVEDAVFKNTNNPQALIKQLKPLELQLYKSLEIEKALEDKLTYAKKELIQLKEEKKKQQEKLKKLEDALFKLFEYSASSDVPLTNLLNTGKTKHKRVKNALNNIFSNPEEFFFSKSETENNEKNVVNLNEKFLGKKKENILDDYDF
ncbi:hypothetical protein BATDEDRAFT_93301 [Batrachochytrium dendrobatidis JAM81]|uniref:Uncharacterized protein n=1 Tax=Batrachochytrium dendrobatidis (strain JAM81 / FGSC 10211) TaxID=684364 RepID=F4PG11_BATDJ|nr:uncharacterized protein BATDEDRAFT_93301 [Batrachochytrium dendrobatidis JAM81]EGF75832.1 hypothetical protein BATDEDRAFT_93301 [Batrachochytrium dendrobatidis JAM81]|eukprot:XP_006683544.1 hypothetical protein BATDEDRAFT_93301 [Batrachochytrium dendrobatidis JAM81]